MSNLALNEMAGFIATIEDQQVALNLFKELHVVLHWPGDTSQAFALLANKLTEYGFDKHD